MICICSDGPVEAAAKASVGTRPTIGGMAKFRHWFYEMEWSKNSYGKVYFLWFHFFVQAKKSKIHELLNKNINAWTKWTEKENKPSDSWRYGQDPPCLPAGRLPLVKGRSFKCVLKNLANQSKHLLKNFTSYFGTWEGHWLVSFSIWFK